MIQTFDVLPKIEEDDNCGIIWPLDIYKFGNSHNDSNFRGLAEDRNEDETEDRKKDDSCGITWPPDIYKSGIFISFQNRSVFAAIK